MNSIIKKEINKFPIQKSQELKKHVAMIHSYSKISLLQKKISNALLFNAYENLLNQEEHHIHISELNSLIGYDSHDYKKIKNSLMQLLATVVQWNIIDGDKIDQEGTWNASSIIADASIDGSLCTYSYSNKMRALLYHPSVYGRLNMAVQAKFQSAYGLALYENCNRYQDIGQTPWFTLEKFRKLMGVEENKYKIFRDFKTRVIDKSVEEVNKYSFLSVEPKIKKQNRQVVAVQFLIKKIKANNSAFKSNQKTISEILKLNYGLSEKQINEVILKFDDKYINEKIKLIETSTTFNSGKIKNLGKYLLCALNDNYQMPKSAVVKKIIVNKSLRSKRTEYEKYRNTVLQLEFDNSPENIKNFLINDFREYLKKTTFSTLYAHEGFDNILVKDAFIRFLAHKAEISHKNTLSYEIWLEKNY